MTLSCSQKLSALLRGITSKHNGDFYCLNCLHSFRTKNKLESHKEACKIFCSIIMPSGENKISELDQYKKYDKVPFIFIQVLSIYSKRLMDVKIILKNYLQQR